MKFWLAGVRRFRRLLKDLLGRLLGALGMDRRGRLRMGFLMLRDKMGEIDFRITLGGLERLVSQQLLDGAQVASLFHQMRCERMA